MRSHTHDWGMHLPSSQPNSSGEQVRPAVHHKQKIISSPLSISLYCHTLLKQICTTFDSCKTHHRIVDFHRCCPHSCYSRHTSWMDGCRCWCSHTLSSQERRFGPLKIKRVVFKLKQAAENDICTQFHFCVTKNVCHMDLSNDEKILVKFYKIENFFPLIVVTHGS